MGKKITLQYGVADFPVVVLLGAFLFVAGCATGVTSPTAEKVKLYTEESKLPSSCVRLGEVTASACANKSPCPAEVMKRELREQAYKIYQADSVLLYQTTVYGSDVTGLGVAYQCSH